jgi:alkylation response protein AidB-like acyl-CoA dehydrogenase
MDFELNDTQKLIQATARELARKVVRPLARDMEASEAVDTAMLRALAEAGLVGVAVQGDLGGADAGAVAYALAIEEVAKACASTAVTLAVTNMVCEVVARFGSPAQRERVCPRLCSGEWRAASFALSEPEAGSDPGSMRTTATRTPAGWVLRGAKQWVTNGAIADVFVVWARTDSSATNVHAKSTKGLSCFLIERAEVNPSEFAVGRHEDKMGLRASSTTALELNECHIPPEAVLGAVGDGFRIAMTALDGGRIGIAAQALGVGERALELGVRYARERSQFGRPIAEFQALQRMIADSRTELDAARLLTLRAAWGKQTQKGVTQESSMAKLFASEAAWRVCNRMLQIHGGYGYTREFDVERLWRDVRVAQIYEGTSEIQRWVIARSF